MNINRAIAISVVCALIGFSVWVTKSGDCLLMLFILLLI